MQNIYHKFLQNSVFNYIPTCDVSMISILIVLCLNNFLKTHKLIY